MNTQGGGKDNGRPPSGDKMRCSDPNSLMERSTTKFLLVLILRLIERVPKVSHHAQAGNNNP